MNIVHTDGYVLASVHNNHVTFHYPSDFEQALKINGITIPGYLLKQFGGEKLISFNHPLFAKALTEYYIPEKLKDLRIVPA